MNKMETSLPYELRQSPNLYGRQQEDYVRRSNEIVDELAATFSRSKKAGEDLLDLFYRVLGFLGEKRNLIAQDHETKDASRFGKPRYKQQCDNLSTRQGFYLTDHFLEYGMKLYHHFSNVIETVVTFRNNHRLEYSTPDTRNTAFDFFLLGEDDISKITVDDVQQFSKIAQIENSEDIDSIMNRTIGTVAFREKWYLQDSGYYNKMIRSSYIENYKRGFSTLTQEDFAKKDCLWIAQSIKINNIWIPISQYFAIISQIKNDIISFFPFYLCYPDNFHTDILMKDIAQLFKKAIEWTGEDLQMLTRSVALLHFEYSHAFPFFRGSAATAKWLERAIYQHHGFNVTYNNECSVNLSALTSPLSDFLNQYQSMITLTKNV